MSTTFDSWEAELYHHGILGQKWGVRRFQNEDGSWTPAGEARYGKDFKAKTGRIGIGIRTRLTDNDRAFGLGSGDLRDGRVAYYENRVAKYSEKKSKVSRARLEKAKLKLRAQKASNSNRETYENRTSIATLWIQNKIFGNRKATLYREARARGSGKTRSFVESHLSYTPIGYLMRRAGNKRTYGTQIRW